MRQYKHYILGTALLTSVLLGINTISFAGEEMTDQPWNGENTVMMERVSSEPDFSIEMIEEDVKGDDMSNEQLDMSDETDEALAEMDLGLSGDTSVVDCLLEDQSENDYMEQAEEVAEPEEDELPEELFVDVDELFVDYEAAGEEEATLVDEGKCGENAFWKFTSDGTLTIYGSGEMDSYSGYAKQPYYSYSSQITSIVIEGVSNIGNWAFACCGNLKEVTLPNTLMSIGEEAFYTCPLKEISLPEAVNRIGTWAFRQTKLETIYLPKNVSEIGFDALKAKTLTQIAISEDNPYLSSCGGIIYSKDGTNLITVAGGVTGDVIVPSGVTSLAVHAFADSKVTRVILPDGLSTIGEYCFYNCNELYEIVIPATVQTIPTDCFYGCSKLKEIVIPDSVQEFGTSCFSYCHALESIHIPSGVTSLNHTFRGCTLLEEIDIPSRVISLYNAFEDCSSLKRVNIPSGVTSLYRTFYGCTSLENVMIPASVTSIEANTFTGTSPNLTFTGYSGSMAEAYALEKGIPFIKLPHEHEYTETVTKEPNCMFTGILHRTCFCGLDIPDETIPALGHAEMVKDEESSYPSTCTDSGKDIYRCPRCGVTLQTDSLPALGHSYGDWEVGPINELEDCFYEIQTCTVCNKQGNVRKQGILIQAEDLDGLEMETGEMVLVHTRVGGVYVSLYSSSRSVALRKISTRYTVVKAVSKSRSSSISYQKNKRTYKCDVTIVSPTTSLSVSKNNIVMANGSTVEVPFTRNEDADDEIIVTSEDPSVAAAVVENEMVMITGLKAGTTTLYVRPKNSSDNGMTDEIKVQVLHVRTQELSVEGSTALFSGCSTSWKIFRNRGADDAIMISTSDPDVVKAVLYRGNVLLTAYHEGTAEITIGSGEKSLTRAVRVQERILLEGASSVYAGNKINWTIGGSVDEDEIISVTSSNTAVATVQMVSDKVQIIGKSAGTARITVTAGATTKTKTVTVNKNLIFPAISSISNKTYTGSTICPAVKVGTLVKGTDYTVTYSNNKAIGKATVKITGKGAYYGQSKTLTFRILPKKVSGTKLTSPKAGQVKVTWTKGTSVSGYQIKYAYASSFSGSKTVTVKSGTTVSKLLSSLTSRKTCYVKIRAYKTVNGTKYYGSWNASCKVAVK